MKPTCQNEYISVYNLKIKKVYPELAVFKHRSFIRLIFCSRTMRTHSISDINLEGGGRGGGGGAGAMGGGAVAVAGIPWALDS